MVHRRPWKRGVPWPPLGPAVGFTGLQVPGSRDTGGRRRPRRARTVYAATALAALPDVHPTRRRILEYLRVIPGDHFRSIARNLGLSVGETRHHLDMLIRDGFVVERKELARSRYYVSNPHADADRNELFSRQWAYRDLRMRILTKVRAKELATGKEVAQELGISRQLAAYHLARLEELGFVHRDGRKYRATPVRREEAALLLGRRD